MEIRRHGGPQPQRNNTQHTSSSYPDFCNECGAKLIWAPVNDTDDSVELVCPGCGVVYSPILSREKVMGK